MQLVRCENVKNGFDVKYSAIAAFYVFFFFLISDVGTFRSI